MLWLILDLFIHLVNLTNIKKYGGYLSPEIKGHENESIWDEVTHFKHHTNDINRQSFPTTQPCS